jgi:N,N-dimethylformamidase beta subunit-like, C-terminal
MRLWLRRGDVVFIVFVAVAVLALLLGVGLFSGGANKESTATPPSNPIIRENALTGTRSWQIPVGKGATIQIQAYASATSVLPGQQLTFYVSTQVEGISYSINIYRIGWYKGQGGRLMISQANQVGHAQGYWYQQESDYHLVGCHSCRVDKQTGLVEANWQPSYTLTVPPDWTTGVYLAKFVDAHGFQTYAPFDVRGDFHSLYVAVTSDTTYEAYNDWGGYSLYRAYASPEIDNRGVKVSFDRPYTQGDGSGYVLDFEIDAIRWFERQGYDISYMSSVDLHENLAQLLQHRAYLSLGHDEYWSKEMRDGVEQARDQGVGLAFLGADAAYWQIRFEPDGAGTRDRTVVCYKVQTGNHDLARDPLYGKDNTRVTSQWRDPVLNRPENALIGVMYSSLTDSQKLLGFPWELNPSAQSPLLDGTGLRPGQRYGCDLVGYEWDRIFNNGETPPGLRVLGISRTVSEFNAVDVSNTTYYIARSGALVFASGSIYFTTVLDSYRLSTDTMCVGQNPAVPGIQKLMANVMSALVFDHPLNGLTSMPVPSTPLSPEFL